MGRIDNNSYYNSYKQYDASRKTSSGNSTNTKSVYENNTNVFNAFDSFERSKPGNTNLDKSSTQSNFFNNKPSDSASNKESLFNWCKGCAKGIAESVGKGLKNIGQSVDQMLHRARKWVGNKLNGKIDAMSQGGEGNCALLASIEALGSRPDAEKILKETIHESKNGKGYNITFKGAKKGSLGSKEKPIYISKSQVAYDSTKQRSGKSDLETAILNQAVKRKLGAPPYVPSTTLSLLTGEKSKTINTGSINKMLKKGASVVAHIGNHAWMVEGYKNGKLILRNPHNTSRQEVRSTAGLYALYATKRKNNA